MRYFLLIALFLAGLLLIQTKPEIVSDIADYSDKILSQINDEQSYRITGLSILNDKDILALIPKSHGNFWWLLNNEAVAAELGKNSFIKKAAVSSCSKWILPEWGCFNINVEEREPAFIAELHSKLWVVGQDGGFILPLVNSEPEQFIMKLERKFGRMRVLKGLEAVQHSPDLTMSKFEFAKTALNQIEDGASLGIEWAKVEKDNELKVKFKRYPFTVAFGGDNTHTGNPDWSEQGQRLKMLLSKLQNNKISQIVSIDLAYNRLGVIRFSTAKDAKL